MKKVLFTILLAFISLTLIAQSSSYIQITEHEEEVFYFSEDSITLNLLFPITMTGMNYYNHSYDELSGIHLFVSAVQHPDGCGRFDEEFNLWITEDLEYYFSYTDHCNQFDFWRGDIKLTQDFRLENQKSKSYDYQDRR